ncbi:MAG TPA: ABC transporter substrate-binding protein [Aliidongia sp.]|uniref:MlaC/ttg2D family ABC transporter substrate-binding protein n=1 Tax=Aliidongia sp. TaxID=1914230 RepID=UPI002DDD2D74|nr:ABC transporter substrate-binding protein [Aliidongia sp.]HEV2676657.1 ABC transporter substrate-binding protein [Aliidongia sp.]
MWKYLSRYLALGAALLIAVSATPARAADEPGAFIQGLGDQAIQILQNKQLGQKERQAAFNKLFTEGFDVPEIGKFVLGRYWNVASPTQQQEYLKLFGTYVVAVYANRFSQYSGEKFTVAGSQTTPDGASVASQIIRPNGGPPINIVWKISKQGAAYKIRDVVAENLSMAVTQRAEFSSVVERGGGGAAGVDALNNTLKQKIAANGG